MKYIHKILILGLIAAFGLTSCSDFVEGINKDPNNALDAPVDAVLNAAFTGLITSHEGEDARLACMWAQQFTGSDRQYSAFNVYGVNSEDFQWDKFYLVRQNSLQAIELATETDNQLVFGIAKVLQAHSLGAVASLWGDVPFRDANKFPEVEDPSFDPMEQVYDDLINLLDEAIAHFGTGKGTTGADFYFSGDGDAWTRVAYTLKARLLLHKADYSGALAAAENGVMANSENWMIPHTGGAYNQDKNIYNSFGVDDRQLYLTANTAYLPAILDDGNAGYRGNAKTDETSRFANIFTGSEGTYDLNYEDGAMWGATTSFPLVTAVENALIMAECHHRLNSMSDALSALNDARALVAEQYPDGTYDAYEMADFEPGGMANNGGTAEEALLLEIMEEKYVSLVGQIEVYNDFRRTGNIFELDPTTGSRFPMRYLVPQQELDANANAPGAGDLFESVPLFQ